MQGLMGHNEEFELYPKNTEIPLEGFKLEDVFQVNVRKDHCGSGKSIRGCRSGCGETCRQMNVVSKAREDSTWDQDGDCGDRETWKELRGPKEVVADWVRKGRKRDVIYTLRVTAYWGCG